MSVLSLATGRTTVLQGVVHLVLFAAYSATFSFVAIRIDELGGGLFVIGVAAGLQAVAETPVMRADYLFRAIDLPTGTHRVRFLYDPTWFKVGAGLFATTLVALIGTLVWSRRR